MNKRILTILVCLLSAMNTLLAQDTFSGYNVANEGAWCWFADPRAIHYENADKSINMSYIGYIDVHGAVKATQYNWNTGEKQDVLVRSYFQPDDHNNPTFLVLPDERVLIIYSRHTDEPAFYYRVSLKPGDITQLGEEKRLATDHNTTYPSPFLMSDDPTHWYMCWRGISWHPTIARLTLPDENGDCHFDWGPHQMVRSNVSSGGIRPYAKYCSNGKDKIYFSFTSTHPDNECPNWLNFAVVNINGGNQPTLHDIAGNKLSTISAGPYDVYKTNDFKNQHPAVVVDAPSNHRAWVWQVVLDKSNNPRIACVRITNDKSQHEYFYARWTGSKWALTDVCDGGGKFHPSNTERCYSGGEAIDPANPNIMYVSKPTQGTYGNIHEIWKYTISDNGAVASSEQITRNSKKGNVRPYILNNSENSPMRLGWMNGDYQYWIVCSSYPLGYPTGIRCDYDFKTEAKTTDGGTFSTALTMDPNKYYGTLVQMNGLTYSLNATTHKPEIKIGNKTYSSSNQLYTSDAWKTCPATTDGKSYYSILQKWNLTITYDATKKQLTTYRNGLIDQVIDVEITQLPAEFTDGCINQTAVQQAMDMAEIEAINVPEKVVTDIVLPATTASGKSITWTSSKPAVIDATGLVNLPKKVTNVRLTANVEGLKKSFDVKVMPRKLEQNLRATVDLLDLTSNTAGGFSTNKYGTLPKGTLKGVRSYSVVMKVNAKSLDKQPRLYDLGGGSGNSVFLRANALSAGIKYNGGTTTLVNSSEQLTTNKEYSLAVTFDAATKTTKIYIDGKEVASGTANVNEPYMIYESVGDARNYIGRTQWWDTGSADDNVDFVGTIKDFKFYDIDLTRKEVCNIQRLPFEEGAFTTEFVNGDFEGTYTVYNTPKSDRAIYQPKGWTVDYSIRDENDITALKSGDLYYSNFFASLPKPTNAGQKTLWVRQRWGVSVLDYFQNVQLPEGDYALTADIYANANGTNKATIYVGDQTKTVSTLNTWQTVSFTFSSNGEDPIKIGLQANHTADEFICGFDNFKLTRSVNTDYNGDYGLSIGDLITLIAYSRNKSTEIFGTPDINQDGKVDLEDINALLELLKKQ